MKNEKKTRKKTKKREKNEEKKAKEPKEVPPETGRKMIFFRTVKRNHNEIEAQKKSDFEHPTKKNERK